MNNSSNYEKNVIKNTFSYVTKKILNLNNYNIFFENDNKVNGVYKLFFNLYINYNYNNKYKSKFHFLKDTISNFYFKNNEKDINEFINYFYKIQRCYYAFTKLALYYKIKKSRLVISTDLQLNEISSSSTDVIMIYQENACYLFRLGDLLKIIYTSLTNTYMFFSSPLIIKNPYNNLPFSKSTLYNIYYKLLFSPSYPFYKYYYIDIFTKFYRCNFNLTKYINTYEYLTRELAVKNYMTNSTNEELRYEIDNMLTLYNLKQNNINDKIYICSDFPDTKLIKIMKPYLYLKLVSVFSLIPYVKTEALTLLNIKLKEFHDYNPRFGKKKIIFKYEYIDGIKKPYKFIVDYFSDHKKFYNFDLQKFMNNHLNYKYNNLFEEDNNEDNNEENNEENNPNYFINNNINNNINNSSNSNNYNINNNINNSSNSNNYNNTLNSYEINSESSYNSENYENNNYNEYDDFNENTNNIQNNSISSTINYIQNNDTNNNSIRILNNNYDETYEVTSSISSSVSSLSEFHNQENINNLEITQSREISNIEISDENNSNIINANNSVNSTNSSYFEL